MGEERLTHSSFWYKEELPTQRFEALQGSHQTQVLVIGAGITGLSTALECLRRGFRVTVCEANVIGSGTTGGSSGHLDAHPEMGPAALLRSLGEEKGRLYTQLRRDAIQAISERVDEHCDFVHVPAFHYSTCASPQVRARLKEDCAAAHTLGLQPEWVSRLPLTGAAFGYRMDRMARIDCGAYLRRLTDMVVAEGGTIFEHTLVQGPTESNPSSLKAGAGEVSFDHVVCCVHCNFTDASRIYAQTPAYQSYVLAARVSDPPEDALYWDHSDPYFYVRKASSSDPGLLLIGGCDHRTGSGDEREAALELEEFARSRFDVEGSVFLWSAELFEPADGLPIIGRVPGKQNVWIATGLSGVGLTQGTAAGWLIADQLLNHDTPLQDEFSPSRFAATSAATIVKEQLTAARSYSQRILPAHEVIPQDLIAGEGQVGTIDGKHVAVCRDREGCEHQLSPICSHMGGVVKWNEVEQTWDCPVHGGRFAPDGTRVYGPPEQPLEILAPAVHVPSPTAKY